MPVSTLLNAAAATDIDEDAPFAVGVAPGVAITFVDDTNGRWKFTLDGTTFNELGLPTAPFARLLDATNPNHKIRFEPDPDFFGTATIKYRAWDKTDGRSAGEEGNTSTTGGSAAFSRGEVTKTIIVNSVNDQPNANLLPAPPILEDAPTVTIPNFTPLPVALHNLKVGKLLLFPSPTTITPYFHRSPLLPLTEL